MEPITHKMEGGANAFLVLDPVGKLMKKFSIPCIISLLAGALYNIVDQIFIANADYLGSNGNAANTVVFPLTVVALAIAIMIGDGACAFVSISLGAKQHENAHRSVGNAVLLAIISSIVLTALYFIFMEPVLTLFGGKVNEETFSLSKEYFVWIAAGLPFYMFGQAMNPIIRSDGSPRFAMITTIAGAVLNIILDPIFIFVFRWGMTGAAAATVLGQIVTAVFAILYLCRMKAVKLQKESFVLNGRLISKFLPLGISSLLSQISLVVSMASINNMIKKYGAQDNIFGQEQYAQIPMAVVGIVMKFYQIVISIVIGIAAGCIPIVGYNLGAKHNDRVKSIFSRLLMCEALVGVIAFAAVEIFPGQFIDIFGANNESVYYTNFAIKAFRTYLCLVIFACVNKAAFIFLQAMGKPWVSTFLSMLREVVFGAGFPLILPLWFGLNGVLYSMPLSDLLTFIVSMIVIKITYNELNKNIHKTA
jgi:putative MATE family efflux protein